MFLHQEQHLINSQVVLRELSSYYVNIKRKPQSIDKSAELLRNMYAMRNADELKPSKIRKELREE